MKRIHISKRKCIWFGSALLALLLALLLEGISDRLSGGLKSQQMASRWSEKRDVAQISCFFAAGSNVTPDTFVAFEHGLDSALMEASITLDGKNPGARLWVDAYSAPGEIFLQSDYGSVQSRALGVGGEFFLFHPLKLLSGNYFSGDTLNQDYCMLDQDLAWQLYGSNDVAGKYLSVNDQLLVISGVVERPQGKLYTAAGLEKPLVYLPYETLQKLGKCGEINHYEILMPNPVEGFAGKIVEEKIGVSGEQTEIINNSERYGFLQRLTLWTKLYTRSMNGKAIIYPYWENIARYYEDVLARISVVILACIAYAVLVLLALIVIWYRHRTWTASSVIRKLQDRIYDLRTRPLHKKGERKKK